MRQFSIREYVAWLTFIPLFILAVALETYFLHDRFSDMDEDMLENGELMIHQLASSSEYGVFSNNLNFLQDVANSALHQRDVRGVAILNPDSGILVSAGTFSEIVKNGIVDPDVIGRKTRLPLASIKDNDEVFVLRSPAGDKLGLWLFHAIVPAQVALDDGVGTAPHTKPIGSVIVEISLDRLEKQKTRMFWVTLVITLLFLGLTLYLVHVASRRIILPIRRLSEAVQAIGSGKLDTRVQLMTGVRELATLAQGLNTTTEHLEREQEVLQQCVDEATSALRVKKDEAERASHDKSRFLAAASHDLRQPLHALGLYVAELQRKVTGTEHQRLATQIEQSVESLSALLNALLDISKLDAGAIIPQIRPCSVTPILKRITADYHLVAEVKNIRLVIRPCQWLVKSDPLLLERILGNLVSNAIRYTYHNGAVMVACRRRGQFLRIEVRDNGVGISNSDRENIYREFFQLAQPQLDTSKGLGLGLAIVDRLAKLLGYRIELRSALGEGSVFALEVPLAAQENEVPEENDQLPGETQQPESTILAGKRILVVDDDPAVLSSSASFMSSWGCKLGLAASVAQVRHLILEGNEWDFIVSDYQLENDTNGIEVVDLVRQHQGHPVPCILITGDTSPSILKLVSVSGHYLLHKPVRPAKLRSLIEHILGNAEAKSRSGIT